MVAFMCSKPADAPVLYSGGLGFEASRDFLLTGEVVCMGAFTSRKGIGLLPVLSGSWRWKWALHPVRLITVRQ